MSDEYEAFIADLNKAMGGEAFLCLNSEDKKVATGLSSGSFLLNYRLSGNPFVGYAFGRIVEIYGEESSGKTTLALHAIAEAHKLEENDNKVKIKPVFIDAEHALDPVYAQSIGVDLKRLAVSQPDNGEQAIESILKAIENGSKLVIVDSVAALTPKAEIEGDMGDSHMGLQARLMGQALRKLTGVVCKRQVIVIFINQIRMKIGQLFGNPTTTPGGKALKFYASYRLEVSAPRGGKKEGVSNLSNIKSEQSEIGTITKVKIVKNKLYPPFKKATLPIVYGKGIDKGEDIINYLDLRGYLDGDGIEILSLNKKYKKIGLKKRIHEVSVQQDVIDFIKGYK